MFHVKHSISRHTVPRETFAVVDKLIDKHQEQLEGYIEQLLWWNQRVNLVSRNVSRGTLREHVRHSLLLSELHLFQKSKLIVDAGTGGGLPGLPLAIVHPQKRFVLNDIVSKKVLAVRQMIRKTEITNAEAADSSIENLHRREPFLLVSKHAFKIDDLWNMTHHLPWTEMVFYKGSDFIEELTGIETPLAIDVYDLFANSDNEFYKEKALVIVHS